ncbi:hypothetical protein OOK13_05305 [Streptomyces sp. NBC_00378]|uniref:hypothetical protein n=1 Tax=unclassified Streptomyces TaxID=2593676 RepID=UPI00224D6128|nr:MULTISPECIES: hypothetical protein [unclassified Streptomyces]MCX5107941.1 hypothetical protein [Streptomyces sp. NBC_00378]
MSVHDELVVAPAAANTTHCATGSLGYLDHEPDPPILTSGITAPLSRTGPHTAVFGAARPSRGARTSSSVMTLTAEDLEPGDAAPLRSA